MEEKVFLGALPDTRSDEEKQKDFLHEEIAGAVSLEWKEKLAWNTYPIKRQYYTYECVAQSTTKMLGINNKQDIGVYENLSAGFFYALRSNKDSGGMYWVDAMNIAVNIGACLDIRIEQRKRETDPLPNITQEMIDEAKKFKGKSYFTALNRDIDTIAQIIEQQGKCLMWFWFDEAGKEWWKIHPEIKYPDLGTNDNGATRHSVLGVDYGIKDGKKVIIIEDSAGNETAEDFQRRYIDEDFLKRCFMAGYVIDNPTPKDIPENVKYHFNRSLKVGDRGSDVKELQKVLISEGCLVLPYEPTEYFGGLTRAAVVRYQEKYTEEILKPWGLTKGTGFVGGTTLKKLNS